MTSKHFTTSELPSKTYLLIVYLLIFATSAVASILNDGNKNNLMCEDPPDNVLHAMLNSPGEVHESFFQLPVLLNMSTTLETFKTNNSRQVKIKHSVIFDDGNSCSRDYSAVPNFDPCPLRWVFNVDDHRRPKVLVEAQCKKCHGGCMGKEIEAECKPIRYHVKVLRRSHCDQSGKYNYTQVWEPITVGCACRGVDYRFDASGSRGAPSNKK
ncbi:uncharacterized protein LOC112562509 [Pomacea canaliculata]|uniref:uncharacterized protein LOC112562509 n=1 Tax=Pomacea canaliculata TaxID=400727 RepID=UPI000D73B144|nr:uncharacterized protein LOC112562509 [Pomacea canaliculata]